MMNALSRTTLSDLAAMALVAIVLALAALL